MVYEFEELCIALFIQMFIWWKKKFAFWILFYFIFPLYDIWFIDYEKEINVDLCFGEKYTYKSWFACMCIVIHKNTWLQLGLIVLTLWNKR